ncbi:MAG TPA: rod shape-determining protein [Eubacteriales bacterium]|jgi:rod shape-determining protein MreB|nr:rod shape-determining protein [Clostridia bacterium]HRR89555.1 rod shape-determining protein [Eubacteriales bacterium]HRU84811.1 rod shape-determining protein [Eubacteriales bacterium]
MAKYELAVDLGSSHITIFLKGSGLVLREPTIAAVVKQKNKFEIIESGFQAKNLMTRSLGGARLVFPVKEGTVADIDILSGLLKIYLDRIMTKSARQKAGALVLVSSALTGPERKEVEKAFAKAGIKDVFLVESPLALIAYTDSAGGLFVDIGGGKSEIASVTRHGIAAGYSVNIAGNAMNNAIIDMVTERYRLKIGDYTAERAKISSASLYDNDKGEFEAGGRDLIDGSPKTAQISSKNLKAAIAPLAEYLVEVIESVLAATPPELAAEIGRRGLYLSGGTAALPGLKEFLSARLSMPVTPLADIENAVAIGGGRLLSDNRLLSDLTGITV